MMQYHLCKFKSYIEEISFAFLFFVKDVWNIVIFFSLFCFFKSELFFRNCFSGSDWGIQLSLFFTSVNTSFSILLLFGIISTYLFCLFSLLFVKGVFFWNMLLFSFEESFLQFKLYINSSKEGFRAFSFFSLLSKSFPVFIAKPCFFGRSLCSPFPLFEVVIIPPVWLFSVPKFSRFSGESNL